jgi:hypothetical protein
MEGKMGRVKTDAVIMNNKEFERLSKKIYIANNSPLGDGGRFPNFKKKNYA